MSNPTTFVSLIEKIKPLASSIDAVEQNKEKINGYVYEYKNHILGLVDKKKQDADQGKEPSLMDVILDNEEGSNRALVEETINMTNVAWIEYLQATTSQEEKNNHKIGGAYRYFDEIKEQEKEYQAAKAAGNEIAQKRLEFSHSIYEDIKNEKLALEYFVTKNNMTGDAELRKSKEKLSEADIGPFVKFTVPCQDIHEYKVSQFFTAVSWIIATQMLSDKQLDGENVYKAFSVLSSTNMQGNPLPQNYNESKMAVARLGWEGFANQVLKNRKSDKLSQKESAEAKIEDLSAKVSESKLEENEVLPQQGQQTFFSANKSEPNAEPSSEAEADNTHQLAYKAQ